MIPATGNEILVDAPETASAAVVAQPGQALVSWVVGRVKPWEEHRDRGYARKWGEYWRMWRGQWSDEDRNRLSERSRLIAPALAQAIEQTVSEIEEALFSKDVWIDLVDGIKDEEKGDALLARDLILEDLEAVNAKDAISETLLNAAIFGTGVMKVSTFVGAERKPRRNHQSLRLEASSKERVFVTFESVRPDEFIPDPAGRTIQEMLGCAHKVVKPMHAILEKIESGTYRTDALPLLTSQRRPDNGDIDRDIDPQSMVTTYETDQVEVTEYHGKVPLGLLNQITASKSPLDDLLKADPDADATELVEAIVTIANGSVLLRAIANPFVMHDRSIIAFQFEKVPGRFWGRGVSEKGYNPQKALDAEIRARIDALGFISSPMLGVDSGRVPRGFKMEIKPGKVWLTQGNPSEVLQPISIGALDANTFNQASEMERMVQMGTGSFDTATSLKSQSQSGSNALSANSMLMGAFVKRAKRAIGNVDRNLVQPAIQKALWRYMQFDPVRYPRDYEFRVVATLGIMAREVEAMQLTQLIGMLPEEFPKLKAVVALGIVENTSVSNKGQIIAAINEALAPPPEEVVREQQELAQLQKAAAKAQAESVLLQNQKTLAEIRKLLAEAQAKAREADVKDDQVMQEQQRIAQEFRRLDIEEEANRIALEQVRVKREQISAQKAKPAAK